MTRVKPLKSEDSTEKQPEIKHFKAKLSIIQFEILLTALNTLMASEGLKMGGIPHIMKRYRAEFSTQKSLKIVEITITNDEAILIQTAVDLTIRVIAQKKVDVETCAMLTEVHKIVIDGYFNNGGK